jgi:hypothetical protein
MVRSQVLLARKMTLAVFRDTMPCSLLEIDRSFGGVRYLLPA